MQKFWIVLAAFLCLPACLSAQYRASQGDVGVEVQFDPFGFRDVDEGFGGAKFRVFLTDRDALRLNVDFGLESVRRGVTMFLQGRTGSGTAAANP